jgi:polynucleotide 5'-hydroxyl-kinase GRC3/NOL9
MGWTKGLGAELAARVESVIRPDIIYDLTTTLERSSHYRQPSGLGNTELSEVTLPPAGHGQPYLDAYGAFVAPGPRIVPLQAIGLDLKLQEEAGVSDMVTSWPTRRLTPADQRSLSIMTALQSDPRSSSLSLPTWDFSLSLLEQRPYVLDVQTGLAGGVQFFPPLARPVDVAATLAALNGELVGLAVVREDSAEESPQGQDVPTAPQTMGEDASIASSWTALLSSVPLPPSFLNFLSLALIRSIDPAKGHIHLLCPYPLSSLLPVSASASRPKLALIKSSGEAGSGSSGSVELPVWASLDAPAILAARSGRLGVDALGASNGEVREVAGVRLEDVPYLEWPLITNGGSWATDSDMEGGRVIGKDRRRVRRNLMRKNQG